MEASVTVKLPHRPLRIEVFTHVPFEGLGCMEAWCRARGHALSFTRWHEGGSAAAGGDADWIIVMGGPMGVHDEDDFPWLREEKRALEKALGKGRAVLGICLGAQLLAHVLGARVYRHREREIGWFPLHTAEEMRGAWPGRILPACFTAFHWHGDTFDIPAGALPLGRTEACANQGFLYGENALALQFHPEITPPALEALMENCRAELVPAPFVQDPSELTAGLRQAPELNRLMDGLCGGLEAACRAP